MYFIAVTRKESNILSGMFVTFLFPSLVSWRTVMSAATRRKERNAQKAALGLNRRPAGGHVPKAKLRQLKARLENEKK